MTVNENDPFVMALAHAIRRQAIECIAKGLTCPSDIAEAIDRPLGVVSYHVRMLRDYGVLEVTSTTPVRGALRHDYQFTALAAEGLARALDMAEVAHAQARGMVQVPA